MYCFLADVFLLLFFVALLLQQQYLDRKLGGLPSKSLSERVSTPVMRSILALASRCIPESCHRGIVSGPSFVAIFRSYTGVINRLGGGKVQC